VPAAEAARAGETLAGALTVAERLPAELGTALADSARAAFDSGVVATSVVGIVLAAGAVVLALATVRGRQG
jgi:DHA2 family multidrug resistance protein-like MFS transporter